MLVVLAIGGPAALSAGAGASPPTGTTDVVLRVFTGGGYVPEQVRLRELPELTVYGDGRMIVAGPTTLEYPGPALPNLRELRLTPGGMARIVRLARTAGLFGAREPDYGTPPVTDHPSTTVTVDAGGAEVRVSVYALGFDDDRLTDRQQENRARLQRLIARAERPPRRFVVDGSRALFEPGALDVNVAPVDTSPAPPGRPWPLGSLVAARAAAFDASSVCFTVMDDDAATLVAAARDARADTVWESDGRAYEVVLVPLLPDQRGCSDDVVVRIDIGRNGWGGENGSFAYEKLVVHTDGRIVVDNVEHRVQPDEVAGILDAADTAGLTGSALDYGDPGITDQGTVVVQVTTDDGTVHRIAVYALGMEDVDSQRLGLTHDQLQARHQLSQFIELVANTAAS